MRPIVTSDGEPIILYQSFSDEVQEAFRSNHIDYIKGGASTTSIHNALDRTVVFRDMKRGTQIVSRKGLPQIHTLLNERLQDVLGKFEAEALISIGSEYKKSIQYGLVLIVHCLQNGYCTPEKLIHGFTCCGQHVYPTTDNQSTIDFHKIMRQCSRPLTQEELSNMQHHAQDLMQILINTGEIKDEDYDVRGIPKLPDDDFEIRDEYVLPRQRCVIITNNDTVARYKEYRQRKANANDAVFKHYAALVRAEEKAKQRQDIKEMENERKLHMTDLEKQQEKVEKKRVASEKKAAKISKDAADRAELKLAHQYMESKGVLYEGYEPREMIIDEAIDIED
jgi:hypothetical protein